MMQELLWGGNTIAPRMCGQKRRLPYHPTPESRGADPYGSRQIFINSTEIAQDNNAITLIIVHKVP